MGQNDARGLAGRGDGATGGNDGCAAGDLDRAGDGCSLGQIADVS